MNLISFVKKYQLVLILSFLVVVLIIIKIVYSDKVNQEQSSQISPVITPQNLPTAIPTEFLQIEEEITDVNDNYPLGQILPYQTDDFIVEKYVAEQVLKVKAISENKIKIIEEINKWIASYDLEPGSHKIVWEE